MNQPAPPNFSRSRILPILILSLLFGIPPISEVGAQQFYGIPKALAVTPGNAERMPTITELQDNGKRLLADKFIIRH